MPLTLPVQDPVLVFAMVAALILLSPIVMGRYRLPGMIGLLVAGALLGPNALGVLARDQSFVLFGTVGLLYIMFTAALEIDLAVFKRYRLHSLVFGLLTFGIPQGLGTLVGRFLFGFDWPAAILLASMFASHTLLAYPIASRLGIARDLAVTTTIGGTIFTDTAALLVLAVIAGATRGDMNPAFWYRLGASFTVYVLVIMVGLPRLGRWFFRNVGRDGVSEFVFVLAAVFASASLSHLAGVEPIVGAFLAGLALNRLIPHASTLMNRIQFTGEAVFVPFFLLSVGMLLDVRIFLGGARSWLIAAGMLVTVTFTKWLAAAATRPLLRFGRDQARVVFGLSVAQAAATLAAVMVGYELGLFDDAVVNGAILMILGTCILAPWVVDRAGRALALAADGVGVEPAGPSQRILVALSKPATAQPLLDLALLLRDPAQGQPIYPLTVVAEGSGAVDDVAQGEKMLAGAIQHLAAADVPAHAVTRIDLNIAAGMVRARRELRATELVIGWRGKSSPPEVFFGSVLEKLLEDRHYTLVTSRLVGPLNTCHRVLLVLPPNAHHEPGFAASLRLVKRLARQLGKPLVLVCETGDEAPASRRIAAVKPHVDLKVVAIEAFSELRYALADLLSEDDFLILYGVRTGGLAWRPELGTLPSRLARRFPENNLLFVYPAEPRDEEAVAAVASPLEIAGTPRPPHEPDASAEG
jgi:Kef-type K+ transport system membrane component KefB